MFIADRQYRTQPLDLANLLLDQQIRRLEKDFLQKGGLRENMTRARLDYRDQQKQRRPWAKK